MAARRAIWAAAMLVAGCTTLVNNTGYAPTDLQLQDITPGTDTRDTVAEKVGRPPLDDLARDDVWYYITSRYETYALFKPEEVNREVVAISFTDAGAVTNIERFGLERGEVVTLSRRVTDPSVPDVGFLRSLINSTSLRPTFTDEDPI